ncbi:MAG: type II toxin-antitoxin system VapC family toxin [Candidatus Aenigmarchaeota archaeon]|nr:type II toxin-antitoxin system VapC family toxin [Candidatus Aenigmarchaeota archaeon]
MTGVLIDTDIHIDFLRNVESAKKTFQDIVDEKIIGLSSVITEAELFSGKECNNPEKKIAVENLLSLTSKIEVDSIIAKKAGKIRRVYNIPMIDALIASSAIATDSILYSRNLKHFKKIKELKFKVPY